MPGLEAGVGDEKPCFQADMAVSAWVSGPISRVLRPRTRVLCPIIPDSGPIRLVPSPIRRAAIVAAMAIVSAAMANFIAAMAFVIAAMAFVIAAMANFIAAMAIVIAAMANLTAAMAIVTAARANLTAAKAFATAARALLVSARLRGNHESWHRSDWKPDPLHGRPEAATPKRAGAWESRRAGETQTSAWCLVPGAYSPMPTASRLSTPPACHAPGSKGAEKDPRAVVGGARGWEVWCRRALRWEAQVGGSRHQHGTRESPWWFVLTTAHGVPAVKALVAGAGPDRDLAADIAHRCVARGFHRVQGDRKCRDFDARLG